MPRTGYGAGVRPFTQKDFLVCRRYVVESNVDDYKAVHVCLEEFARQQRLQNEKNPEWYLYGMKDARDGDQKLLQIKVKLKQEYSPTLCRTHSNFWIRYEIFILNIFCNFDHVLYMKKNVPLQFGLQVHKIAQICSCSIVLESHRRHPDIYNTQDANNHHSKAAANQTKKLCCCFVA